MFDVNQWGEKFRTDLRRHDRPAAVRVLQHSQGQLVGDRLTTRAEGQGVGEVAVGEVDAAVARRLKRTKDDGASGSQELGAFDRLL
jgi:hypothetical protein